MYDFAVLEAAYPFGWQRDMMRPIALEVGTRDLALAAGHGLPTLHVASRDWGDHLFQFSLRSRCTAMLAGLRTLIQTGNGPDR